MKTRHITFVPGVVAADADTTVPGDPKIGALKSAGKCLLTEGTPNTIVRTALTVIKYVADPGAGEIGVKNANTLRCGTAFTASDIVDVEYYSYEDVAGLKDNYA